MWKTGWAFETWQMALDFRRLGGGGTGSRWLQSVKLRKSRKCWHHQQRWVSRDVFSFVWFFGKALCACGETFKMHL